NSSAEEKIRNTFNALKTCDFVCLQSLTLTFCKNSGPPQWTMDPVPLIIPFIGIPLLNTLVTRRREESERTRAETMVAPESPTDCFHRSVTSVPATYQHCGAYCHTPQLGASLH
ncbi:hypothetical protein FRB94_013497, partial [Tulasnella sp. JGI-2019a]